VHRCYLSLQKRRRHCSLLLANEMERNRDQQTSTSFGVPICHSSPAVNNPVPFLFQFEEHKSAHEPQVNIFTPANQRENMGLALFSFPGNVGSAHATQDFAPAQNRFSTPVLNSSQSRFGANFQSCFSPSTSPGFQLGHISAPLLAQEEMQDILRIVHHDHL